MQETICRIPAPVKRSIALLSDLHDRPFDDILLSLEKKRPDIIAIPGDIICGSKPALDGEKIRETQYVLPFLSDCAAIAPTFFSPGNHEYMLTDADLDGLRETGAIVLDNSWASLPAEALQPVTQPDDALSDAPPILIGGLSSARLTYYRGLRDAGLRPPDDRPLRDFFGRFRYTPDSPQPSLDWLDDLERAPGYKILLCHHPEYWEPHLRGRKIDLVLAGHAHGGQFRLFGRGIVATGQGFLPRYTSGVHHGPYGSLIVSRGLTNTAAPIPRLFNPCEIVYVELG